MGLPIDGEVRRYAAHLEERSMTAMLVEIRRLTDLYRKRRGQLASEDRDALTTAIDDLDRYLCAGAPLPGEWCASGGAVGSWEPGAEVADGLVAAAREVERVRPALAEAQSRRRDVVRRALDAGMSPTVIARLARVDRTAVYQIRDSSD